MIYVKNEEIWCVSLHQANGMAEGVAFTRMTQIKTRIFF